MRCIENEGEKVVLRTDGEVLVNGNQSVGPYREDPVEGRCSICLEEIGEYSFFDKQICSHCLNVARGMLLNLRKE